MTATMTQSKLLNPPHFSVQPASYQDTVPAHDGTRIVYVGLLANLALAIFKLACGHVLASKSLIADAWHSFSDTTTDLQALFALFFTSFLRKRDVNGALVERVERCFSVLASGVLLLTAIHVGWESAETLMIEAPWSAGATKNEHVFDGAPSVQAIWPAALTIVGKEWLYRECESP